VDPAVDPWPGNPLGERYAPPPAWQRRALLAGVIGLALVALGWLAWVVWFHATPAVESDLASYDVVDAHHVQASIDVRLEDGVRAHCVVQAVAVDHTVVGEVTFVPHDGRNAVAVRTERAATSVSLEGCTAPGQPRPR
jgi:hypothetical protein